MPGTRSRRPSRRARRFGYLVAILVNLALLYAVNRWPGWDALPFLTGDTVLVLPLVNASMWAGVVANVVYLLVDPPWLRALGDVVTTIVSVLALVRIWAVFPFDFAPGGFDWAVVVRILLGVGIVGSLIGVLGSSVSLVRGLRPGAGR